MDYIKEYANDIQKAFDDCRVDEWHSVIPMSEDGLMIVEKLSEISRPNGNGGPRNLFLHEEEQGLIKPKDSYTKTIYTEIDEDDDYIYISITFESDEGRVAQVTRHDKNRYDEGIYERFNRP
jgi:hypothetical protein